MKIAFCFLTYDHVIREDIWNAFFKNANPVKYKIVVHPKHPHFIYNQSLFKNNIVSKTVDTKWGTFSLIKAQKVLIDESLLDSKVSHIIFISYNTIPVKSFYDIYNSLSDKQSIIHYWNSTNNDHKNRYYTLHNPPFSINEFYTQSQWCILSREDALSLTQAHRTIKEVFNNSLIPDEHAYINYLTHYQNKKIKNKETTKVIWNNNTPAVVNDIPNDYINQLRNENIFFIRKVHANTNVDIHYLTS